MVTIGCDSGGQRTAPTAAPIGGANVGGQMMDKSTDGTANKPGDSKSGDGMMMQNLPEQQFAAHFVSSTPSHGTKLAQAPPAVALKFNFTLGSGSTVSVTKDGKPVNTAAPTVSADKLTLTGALPADSGSGVYIVDYKACWPDNSCHIGKFAFTVGS